MASDDEYRDSGDIYFINKKLMYISYVRLELDTKNNQWDINNCYNEIDKTKQEIINYLYETDAWRTSNVATVLISVLSNDTREQSLSDLNALITVTKAYHDQLKPETVNPEMSLNALVNIYNDNNKDNVLYLAGDFIYTEKMKNRFLGTHIAQRIGASWYYNGKTVIDVYDPNEQEDYNYGI